MKPVPGIEQTAQDPLGSIADRGIPFPAERTAILILDLAVCACAAAFAYRDIASLPVSWLAQYVASVFILMGLSLVQAFFRSYARRVVVAVVRAMFVSVLFVPASAGDPFVGLIAAVFVLECFLDFGSAFGSAFSACFILVGSVLTINPLLLWDLAETSESLSFPFVSLAELLLGTVAGYLLSLGRRRNEVQALNLRDLRETIVRLTDTNMHFQDIATEIEDKTAEAERTRIAREIHDSLGFTLTNVLALLNAYREQMTSDAAPVDEKINQARELIRDGLADLRKVLKTLRTDSSKDGGGWESVVKLVKVFRLASGIDVSLSFVNVPSGIGTALSEVFYHVMQEALTNAFRHGKASSIEVIFRMSGDWLQLTVRDDGTGAEDVKGGFGLVGIAERVSALGGNLEISTSPSTGFALSITVPLAEKDGDA